MTEAFVAFSRTYDLEVPSVPLRPLPGTFANWINTKYRDYSEKRDVQYAELPTRNARLLGNSHATPIEIVALIFPHLASTDIILRLPGIPHELIDTVYGESWRLMFSEGLVADDSRTCRRLTDLWDAAYEDISGYWPRPGAQGDPARTVFGCLAMRTGVCADATTVGLRDGDRVLSEESRLAVYSQEPWDDIDLVGYQLAISLVGRSRHLAIRLSEQIERVAWSSEESSDPWRSVREAALLQRDAIVLRREINGHGYVGEPRMRRLVSQVIDRNLHAADHEDLQASLQGLDSLANGLLSLAIERSQHKLGHYGLFFAAASVLFATLGMVALVEADSLPLALASVAAAIITVGSGYTLVHQLYQRKQLLDRHMSVRSR